MPILGRSLTNRRRECLAALASAVDASGGPAHYSALAAPLAASPWTAYDLLRELEGAGLVAATYAHRPGVTIGRAQVAFAPTSAGRAALGATAVLSEERALRRARASFAGLAPTAAARALLEHARGVDLARHLGFWLQQADTVSARTRAGLHELLRSAPEAATALSMFAAAVYGAVSGAGRDGETAEALAAELSAFQRRLARTTAGRRDRLARSLATLLEARPAAETATERG